MEAYEVSRIVYSRVQAIEPEHVSKIMGYLLLQDRGEQEMLRLAFSQDLVLQELVQKVKKELGLVSASSPSRSSLMLPPFLGPSHLGAPYHHHSHQLQHHHIVGSPSSVAAAGNNEHLYSPLAQAGDDRFLSPSDLSLPAPDPLRLQNSGSRYGFPEVEDRTFSEHLLRNDLQLADQLSFLNDSHDGPPAAHSYGFSAQDYLHPDTFSLLNAKLSMDNVLPPRYSSRRFSTSDLPMSPDSLASAAAWKPCLYYARGYCKHGSTCKFLHSHSRSDASFLLSPSSGQSQDSGSDDGLLPGSLERLELELQELLRGRKAPVSIASLPQLYYERYGKTLQADGYLTESQRHGKAGYSLTKLLARLKNSVTLIDRPHGQHAVVLAEDAHKFTAYRGGGGAEKEEQQLLSGANPGSRQIYLTFPADSAFTEEDVSAHFRAYGPVQDVRIPYQQKRMFGFVTFVYPETVRMILAKGNPHFICGARVLVKPYKEKGKHADRKYPDRDYPRFLAGPQPLDMHRDFDYITGPRLFMEQDLLRRQLEEQERIVEMERKRLAELQLEKHRRYQEQQQQQQQQQSSPPPSPPLIASSLPPSLALHAEGLSTPAVSPQEPNGNSSTLLFEDPTISAEDDLQSIKTSSAFEYLVDAMDGNEAGEELQAQEKYQSKDNKSSDDAHNLPDSPFTSPHKPFSSPPPTPPPSSPPFSASSASALPSAAAVAAAGGNKPTLKSLSSGPPPGFTVPSTVEKTLNCRICKGFFMDRVELDCGHAFCVQCILKVIRVSKDECPICQRHIGSQIVRLIETRRLQVVDMW